jgi:hypothetical protein
MYHKSRWNKKSHTKPYHHSYVFYDYREASWYFPSMNRIASCYRDSWIFLSYLIASLTDGLGCMESYVSEGNCVFFRHLCLSVQDECFNLFWCKTLRYRSIYIIILNPISSPLVSAVCAMNYRLLVILAPQKYWRPKQSEYHHTSGYLSWQSA